MKNENKNNTDLPHLDELERLKLKAEISEITKPVYKRPAFYAALSPVMLGILTLVFTTLSGYFDVALEKNEMRKEQLKMDVSNLEKDKIDLQIRYDSLSATKEAEFNEYAKSLKEETELLKRKEDSIHLAALAKSEELSKELEEQLKELRNSGYTKRELEKKLQSSFQAQKDLKQNIQYLEKKLSSSQNDYADFTQQRDMIVTQSESPLLSNGWVSLKQAPKNKPPYNTKVLVFGNNPVGWYNNVRVGYLDKNGRWNVLNGKSTNLTKLVTHWKYIELP